MSGHATKLYGIYDVRAEGIIGNVVSLRHDAAAVRMFGDIAMDKQSIVGQHVSDFELWYLGTLDLESGAIDLTAAPSVILSGAVWLASQAQEPANA